MPEEATAPRKKSWRPFASSVFFAAIRKVSLCFWLLRCLPAHLASQVLRIAQDGVLGYSSSWQGFILPPLSKTKPQVSSPLSHFLRLSTRLAEMQRSPALFFQMCSGRCDPG